MKKINNFFRKNLFYLVLLSMALGFLLGWQAPNFAHQLKTLIVPILFLMIYAMIIPMEFRELIDVRKFKKETLFGTVAILVLAPLIAWLVNFFVPGKYDFLKAGLILAATMPPGGMIVSWAGLLDSSVELAIILQTITFILAVIAIPLTLSLLLAKSIHFSQWLLVKNILLYIFLPLIIGFITQLILKKRYSKEKIKSWKPNLATISGLCALAVVFIATSLKTKAIISHPQVLIWGLGLAFFYYLATFLITLFLTGLFIDSYDNQMPIVYGTASKNLSIGIALALSVFSGPMVLGIIFCFMIQMPMLSLFYKFIRREEQEFFEEVGEKKRKRHPVSLALRKIRKAKASFKQSTY